MVSNGTNALELRKQRQVAADRNLQGCQEGKAVLAETGRDVLAATVLYVYHLDYSESLRGSQAEKGRLTVSKLAGKYYFENP